MMTDDMVHKAGEGRVANRTIGSRCDAVRVGSLGGKIECEEIVFSLV